MAMSGDIISFQIEADKRHVPDVVAAPMVDPPTDHLLAILELEHEVAELREALADKDLEFRRYRARQSKPVKKVVGGGQCQRR